MVINQKLIRFQLTLPLASRCWLLAARQKPVTSSQEPYGILYSYNPKAGNLKRMV
jgi:hypothetical protein